MANTESEGLLNPSASTTERRALGPRWCFWRRRRLCVATLALLGFVNLYAARVNLSVAIVYMTQTRGEPPGTWEEAAADSSARGPGAGEFAWDSRAQGWLLSAFFYGYAASQVPAGLAAAQLGAARLFGVAVGASAAIALLSPPAARLGGFPALLAARVVLGLVGGLSMPAMSALWARWAPPSERARLASLAASGVNVGTVLVFFLSGPLAAHFGWTSIFYVFGAAGVLWAVLWAAVVFEGPELDPNTPPAELRYLLASLGSVASNGERTTGGKEDMGCDRPWAAMLRSPPLYALTAAHVANNWGAVTFLTQLPMYLHDAHALNVRKLGMLASAPYLLLAALLPGAGHTSDWLVKKQITTPTSARKLLLSGTLAAQAALLMVVVHTTSETVALVCVLIVVTTAAFPRAILLVNHLDLAPQHAGLLMGITNSMATIPGIISPVITGHMVTGMDPTQWHDVFYLMAVLYVAGALIYAIFGSAELQPWAEETPSQKNRT